MLQDVNIVPISNSYERVSYQNDVLKTANEIAVEYANGTEVFEIRREGTHQVIVSPSLSSIYYCRQSISWNRGTGTLYVNCPEFGSSLAESVKTIKNILYK